MAVVIITHISNCKRSCTATEKKNAWCTSDKLTQGLCPNVDSKFKHFGPIARPSLLVIAIWIGSTPPQGLCCITCMHSPTTVVVIVFSWFLYWKILWTNIIDTVIINYCHVAITKTPQRICLVNHDQVEIAMANCFLKSY